MPDAAADDDYDSEGNEREEKKERDAMADLERSQEQSRREMEMMDELADLRQRNARLELSNANADPENLLAALHAERETAEQEERRRREEEEDNAMVRQYFAKVGGTTGVPNGKGKGKEKAVGGDSDEEEDGGDSAASADEAGEDDATPSLTIKRRPAPNSRNGVLEPSVASLLAAKGKVLDGAAVNGTGTVTVNGNGAAPAQVKRKREGMQKLLGIKKKAVKA